MAELSTMSPSPPALGDPHTAPSIPPSSSSPDVTKPKSSLYNDKALAGNSPGKPRDLPPTPQSLSDPPKPPAETPQLRLPVPEAAPVSEEEARMGSEPLAAQQDDPAAVVEGCEAAQSEAQVASPSPEIHGGPNLYPDVHVTHNPSPVPEVADQNKDPAASTDLSENPQTVQEEAQNPQSPAPPPLSPKPTDGVRVELPSTPTRAEHPSPSVPLIHEPVAPFSLPNPNPRPAPDTLSYLESASLMSGTLESLSGLGEDGSSVGSDSEINGLAVRRTDKYGFLGGNQYSETGYVPGQIHRHQHPSQLRLRGSQIRDTYSVFVFEVEAKSCFCSLRH